ncbi:MAG: peptidase U32 family protein [Nanoarchaeota archaeon]
MKPELLSPVQDLVSLKAAIDAGADSIYFGIKELNMRMGAKNFEMNDVRKVIGICHGNDVKAYFTLNTIIYDDEHIKVRKILERLKKEKIDGVICWDFSVIKECEKLGLPIHISTQANVSNLETIMFLRDKIKNLKRINLARELSLEQIKKIIKTIKNKKIDVEIETFVHGAMCVSVSGRCFLSQDVFGRSANRGECLQPCRRKYLIKDIEEEHEFEIGEDYVLSPNDLCTIDIIDRLIRSGIDCFKIEGRNRSPEYVKIVTECYRDAIDYCSEHKDYSKLKSLLKKKIKTVYNRGFSTGFYLGKPMDSWTDVYGTKATKKKVYLGKVLNYYKKPSVAEIKLETADLRLGDMIMFQGNNTGVVEQKVASIEVEKAKIDMGKKGRIVGVKTEKIVRKNDKVFLIRSS